MVLSNVIVDVTIPRRAFVFVCVFVMQNIEEQALATYTRTVPL